MHSVKLWKIAAISAAFGATLMCAPVWAQGTGPGPEGQQSAAHAASDTAAASSKGKAARNNAKGAKQGGSGKAPRANAAEDKGAQHSN